MVHKVTTRFLRVTQGSGKKWEGRDSLDRRTRDTTTERVTDHKNNNLALALHMTIFWCKNVSFVLQAPFFLPSFYTPKRVQ